MGAYNDLDKSFPGLVYGTGPKEYESWRAGEIIDFGAPVFSYEGDDFSEGGDGVVYNAKQDTSTITLDGDLVTSNVITTTVTVDGVAQTPVASTFITDHDTTMALHVTDLEAAITGLDVTLTDGTNNRVFDLLIKGSNINLVTSVVTAGGGQAGTTIAYTNTQVFVGVASYTSKSLTDSVGDYQLNEAINVLTIGKLYVKTAAAVDSNTDAFVELAIGADQGLFIATLADNYDTKCKFRSTLAAAGNALIEVRGQNRDATP